MDVHMGTYVNQQKKKDKKTPEIYLYLSSVVLYASGTDIRQTPHTVLDLLGAYKNIVLEFW